MDLTPAQMKRGGNGEVKSADEAVQKYCDTVKADVETKTGKTYDVFEAKSYTRYPRYSSREVAGTNYFVKVHVGNNECVHIRIFQPSPRPTKRYYGSNLMMHGVQEGKKTNDPVEYFEQNAGPIII